MDRKFLIAWPLIFVAWMAGSFVVHGVLLGADYTALQGALFRTPEDSQQYLPLILMAHVLLSGAFVWIYARGCEAHKPRFAQGLRFGVAMVLMTVIPTYMIYFVVQPTPGMLAVKQSVVDGGLLILLSILTAWW